MSYPILMKSQTSEGKKRKDTGNDKIGEQGSKAEQKFKKSGNFYNFLQNHPPTIFFCICSSWMFEWLLFTWMLTETKSLASMFYCSQIKHFKCHIHTFSSKRKMSGLFCWGNMQFCRSLINKCNFCCWISLEQLAVSGHNMCVCSSQWGIFACFSSAAEGKGK